MKKALDIDLGKEVWAWEADPTHHFVDWASRPVTLVNCHYRKNGSFVRSHFRHISSYGSNGRRVDKYDDSTHEAMVMWLLVKLRELGLEVSDGWRNIPSPPNVYGIIHVPDVVFKKPDGTLCAIEVQRSGILIDTLLERSRWYAHHNIHVLWMFHIKLAPSKLVRAYKEKISPLVYFWAVDYDKNTWQPINASIWAYKSDEKRRYNAFLVKDPYAYSRGEFLLFSWPYSKSKGGSR